MIQGTVDDYGRPLVRVIVHHPASGGSAELDVWIDTGFNGGLTLTPGQALALGLPSGQALTIRIANGAEVLTPTATCGVDWFGKRRTIDALISPGKFALLGLHFLEDHELTINYPARTVTVTEVPDP
jgi:clan AA aspartic protease